MKDAIERLRKQAQNEQTVIGLSEINGLQREQIKTTTDFPIVKCSLPDQTEAMRIEKNGRIFWKQREVETDDEFRAAMMDLHDMMVTSMGGWR